MVYVVIKEEQKPAPPLSVREVQVILTPEDLRRIRDDYDSSSQASTPVFAQIVGLAYRHARGEL